MVLIGYQRGKGRTILQGVVGFTKQAGDGIFDEFDYDVYLADGSVVPMMAIDEMRVENMGD
jgi:hypothetical protein